MRNLGFGRIASMVAAFCVATTVALSAQTFTTLLSFKVTDGAVPWGSLVQGANGNFYGTTANGATNVRLRNDARRQPDDLVQLLLADQLHGWLATRSRAGAKYQRELLRTNKRGRRLQRRHGLRNHSKRKIQHSVQLLLANELH